MDFDHRGNDKHMEIGSLVARTSPWELIEEEMKKCDLVCACCHRIRTRDRKKAGWTIKDDEVPKSVAMKRAA